MLKNQVPDIFHCTYALYSLFNTMPYNEIFVNKNFLESTEFYVMYVRRLPYHENTVLVLRAVKKFCRCDRTGTGIATGTISEQCT